MTHSWCNLELSHMSLFVQLHHLHLPPYFIIKTFCCVNTFQNSGWYFLSLEASCLVTADILNHVKMIRGTSWLDLMPLTRELSLQWWDQARGVLGKVSATTSSSLSVPTQTNIYFPPNPLSTTTPSKRSLCYHNSDCDATVYLLCPIWSVPNR